MARKRARNSHSSSEIWPGFVDALSSLLLVIIFLLVVFVLAQFFLSQALSGRDEALARLSQQVDELADLLALERRANSELRGNVAELSASLQTSNRERDSLIIRLDELSQRVEVAESERDRLVLQLQRADADRKELEEKIAAAENAAEADKETIRVYLSEAESLRRDIATLKETRARLESDLADLLATLKAAQEKVADLDRQYSESEKARAALSETLARREARIEDLAAALLAEQEKAGKQEADIAELLDDAEKRKALLAELRASLADRENDLGALRDRSKELEAKLADEQERTQLAQKEIADRKVELSELQALYFQTEESLNREEKASAAANAQVTALNVQIAALRGQLASLQEALGAAEARDKDQKVQIADLGKRLNQALAQKVQELQRYRSEFFGRLRAVLQNRPGITVVGDRFVFQSEILFAQGSAVLGELGQDQMQRFAETLLEIAADIPPDIDWILRVDGHTDALPISTAQFPSNWELSTARAVSVVKFLVAQGVPARRLAATGFGQFQPLDSGSDEIAFRRNRRIELKLTER